MKKLSNTKPELKKPFAIKRSLYCLVTIKNVTVDEVTVANKLINESVRKFKRGGEGV